MNHISDPLTQDQKLTLLRLARQAIELAVKDQPPIRLIVNDYSAPLNENGASFVTLTKQKELRGCIGALEPYQTLVEDVYEHAVASAMNDYRFYPVRLAELNEINIEISRLTVPHPLDYTNPMDLPALLHPGLDGVILRDGFKRATFLPQVWVQLPTPEDFLMHLCQKMGSAGNIWRQKMLQVSIYHVEEFSEKDVEL
ncbi:MAG: AmmeMemoRadiSam system protein A [Anaerolineae bacterium]|nr:AmmeMemoRadiSam system protein A [Anaerolineae bacterium]